MKEALIISLLFVMMVAIAQDEQTDQMSEESAVSKERQPETANESPSEAPKEKKTLTDQDLQNPMENPKEVELAPGTYIQSSDRLQNDTVFKPLSLKACIEQGIRQNYEEQMRRLESGVIAIDKENSKDAFWYPHIQIFMQTNEQKLGSLSNGKLNDSPISKGASGIMGLSFGEYTLFNWGRDYLQYRNDQSLIDRRTDRLNDRKRDLRHKLLIQYLELIKIKRIVEVRKVEVRHTAFIYRLNREKVRLDKIPQQDYLQSKDEYLRAQAQFRTAQLDQEIADEKMALLLNDPIGTRYLINEEFVYSRFMSDLNDAINLAKQQNPDVKDAKVLLDNSEREIKKLFRDDLPLPKISLYLGAYNYRFDDNNRRFRYETSSAGNSNMDIVATINATWTIWGADGFLNARKRGRALIDNRIAQTQTDYAAHNSSSKVRSYYRNIKYNESQEELYQAKEQTTNKTFDKVLDNYINRRTLFAHFKQALSELVTTELSRIENQYDHLKNTIMMANAMGVDEFPGKNFEESVKKVGEKE